MILTADEIAMIEAVKGGMQVEILYGEWDRKRVILAGMLAEATAMVERPRDQKQYEMGTVQSYYVRTVLEKHTETFDARPHGEAMELMCPKVGHGTIGSRARTAITIDGRLTV